MVVITPQPTLELATESGYGTLAPSYFPRRLSVTYPSPGHLSYGGYYPAAYLRTGYSESGYGNIILNPAFTESGYGTLWFYPGYSRSGYAEDDLVTTEVIPEPPYPSMIMNVESVNSLHV